MRSQAVCRARPAGWGWAVLLAGLLASPLAQALEFVVHKFDDGSEALLIKDCTNTATRKCQEHETMFFTGDSARLENILSKRGFSEVLLFSGGGNLDEGVKVGEVLRKYGTAVRVPRGESCVSACTVAFLGGVIRTVDKDATYEVHAYSRVKSGLTEADRAKIVSYPETELRLKAIEQKPQARRWALRLMTYAQRMIGGRPNGAEIQQVLTTGWDALPRYVSQGELAKDVARVQLEGAAAANTAMMNIERSAMAEAIEILRPELGRLGARAQHALNILDTMFLSDIKRTYSLTPETLRRMGYITPELPR